MRKPTKLKLAVVMSGRPQKEIAESIGMDEATLSRIVNGLHTSDANREAIARELGRTVDELFGPAHDQEAAA